MRLNIALFALFLTVFTNGVQVIALWELHSDGFNLTAKYVAEIDVAVSKNYVWLPGEEVAVVCKPRSANLTIELSIPREVPLVGGKRLAQVISLAPGERHAVEAELAPNIRLRIYGSVNLQALIKASGAAPTALTLYPPCEAKLKTYGRASLNVTFYAVPTVGIEIAAPGFSIVLAERQLEAREMKPSVELVIHDASPVLITAAVLAITILFLYVLRVRQLYNKGARSSHVQAAGPFSPGLYSFGITPVD